MTVKQQLIDWINNWFENNGFAMTLSLKSAAAAKLASIDNGYYVENWQQHLNETELIQLYTEIIKL